MVQTAARVRSDLLACVRAIPAGRVATVDALAGHFRISLALIATLMAHLTDDEREMVPWHRVVAKGGAIGRGPHRDQQFAKLVREGVSVSPAGVAQDLQRIAVAMFDEEACGRTGPATAAPAASGPHGRSRGMKARP